MIKFLNSKTKNCTEICRLISHFHSRLAQSVKGMLAFGIYITHGIACYVAIDLTWNTYIVEKITNDRYKLLWEYVVRTGIVLFTCKNFSYSDFYLKTFCFNLLPLLYLQFCWLLQYPNWIYLFRCLALCAYHHLGLHFRR